MSRPELDRLLTEIGEQPQVVARLLQSQRPAVRGVARTIRERQPSTIVLVARGSSDNAAVYGRYLLEVRNRRLTSLAAPSGLTLYGRGPRLDRTVVIGVSQSGQGEDVVAYVREARAQGAATIAIVNDEESPLAQAAETVLGCKAGPEVSVPATKTVTAQMSLFAMLSLELDQLDDQAAGAEALAGLADALGQALRARPQAAALAGSVATSSIGSVIGRGFGFPPALEIALKLKEMCRTRTEPFSGADFLHGPVALVEPDYGAVLVDVGGRSSESSLALAQAIRQRGGLPVLLQAGAILPIEDRSLPELSLVAPIDEPFAPIVALVLGQLLALELALAQGLDPAQPRGLRKVTSTR